MSTLEKIGRGKTIVLVTLPIVVILAPLAHSVYDRVSAGETPTEAPFLEYPADREGGCVRDTEYMRFHHWELLREVRDASVRDGARGGITLSGCRDCHPSRDRFCNRCHEAVSLQPDCFGCHYYPADPASGDGGEAHGGEEVRTAWTAGTS